MLIAVSSMKKYNPVKSAEKRVFQLPQSSFGLKKSSLWSKIEFHKFQGNRVSWKTHKKKPDTSSVSSFVFAVNRMEKARSHLHGSQ